MKIAFVYDKVIKFGGAERILLSLHEIWPDAPLFTAVYNPKNSSWAKEFKIRPSFLNKFPLLDKFQELSTLLTPFAFEKFSFDEFEMIISITSQDAKSLITKPGTLHVCYCLTPTRYLWSGYEEYLRQPAAGIFNPLIRLSMLLLFPKLRIWDTITSSRPDKYLAISEIVKKRINKYYRRNSEVIYPPVDTEVFLPAKTKITGNYYLIVSRLVPYKRIDYAISAFNILKLPLKIIGNGIDLKRLKNIASNNIDFIDGNLTDEKLCWYYQNCRSLIFPGEEDFGLTPLEAQACGRPVIAYNEGGALESVISFKTGIFYNNKNEKSLIGAVNEFKRRRFKESDCRKNSLRFSKKIFLKSMRNVIEKYLKEHLQNI